MIEQLGSWGVMGGKGDGVVGGMAIYILGDAFGMTGMKEYSANELDFTF